MKLEGKTVFITGAAQGLGQGITEALLERGAKVCIADLNREKGEETVNQFQQRFGKENVFFIKADVTNEKEFEDAFKEAVSRLGNIDIMVNNAGIMDESKWELMIQINVTSLVRGTNLAIGHMNKVTGGKGGLIINTASVAGFAPGVSFPVYGGTKHAVIGFTTSWAANPNVESMGIRFACLCPSPADTALLDLKDHQGMMVSQFTKFINEVLGVAPVSKIVEGFITLVEKDDNNGALLLVGKNEGIQFVNRFYDPMASLPKQKQSDAAKTS
ncbi:hypothetical protein SNE40_011570 [Patella caerulea]|uniref:15-hydroxyprostaglandin dehydrogenase [NAD(+)] n=1 Tax=Patella caerulea TaxID=87958 RepID=A0AAN8JQ62_PATCE